MESTLEDSVIAELWKEHLAAPFPKGLQAKDVKGIDLVSLDADIAGCVDSFVEQGKPKLVSGGCAWAQLSQCEFCYANS